MRFRPQDGTWTDLDEIRHGRPPNCVVKKADSDYREIITSADEYAASGKNRHLIWTTTAGVKYAVECVPFVMPTGAVNVTVATKAYASDGTCTVTPVIEGYLLNESGVLVAATEEAEDVAGLIPTDLYYHYVDQLEIYASDRVTALSAGDFVWLIRRGQVEIYSTATVADNDILISSATVAGQVDPAAAFNLGGTITQYHTGLMQHILGDAYPRAFGLAVATAARTGAGLTQVRLLLPPRHVRTN